MVVEPQGKQLAPAEYVTTGVVICLQSLPPSDETLTEWCGACEHAGWLKLGATVVIPNLQASSAFQASDLALVVAAVCDLVGFDRVLVVGKDMTSQRILEMSVDDSFQKQLAGIILLGPTLPVPPAVEDLPAPLMVLWAQDDEISPFEERLEWLQAMNMADGIATVRECDTGGHNLESVLSDSGCAEAVRNFFLSSFLIADLLGAEEGRPEYAGAGDDSVRDRGGVAGAAAARIEHLTSALPESLREACRDAEEDGQSPMMRRRMTANLAGWIHSGLPTSSE